MAIGTALVGFTVAAPVRAGDAPVAQALFDQAKKAMAAHNYAEACPKLEESYKLQEALGTLLNLAACYEAQGRLATAWTTFLEVASKARAAGQSGRASVARDRAAALAPRLSNLTIDVSSEARVRGLEIRRDGSPVGPAEWGSPLPADPGDHTVEASAPDHRPWSKTISVAAGATTVRVAVPMLEAVPSTGAPPPAASPEAPSPPLPTKDGASATAAATPSAPGETSDQRSQIGRPLGLVVGGVGLAGVAVGAVFGLLTKGAVDRRNQECPAAPCGNYQGAVHDHDQAVQYGLISDIGFIAGGALVAGGAALFFLTPPQARPSTGGDHAGAVAVVPSAGPSSGGITLRGTF